MSTIRFNKEFALLVIGGLLLLGLAMPAVSATPASTALTSPNPQSNGQFGLSTAVSGSNIVVGAPFETAGGVAFAGHAYIFRKAEGPRTTLTSPNLESGGRFGWSVAVSGTSVVIGASEETVDGFENAGHAYIYSTSGGPPTTLASPNPQSLGRFGTSVAVSGTSVVVGAPDESGGGHAYFLGRIQSC